MVAPFRATFRGAVVGVQKADQTAQGKSKVSFELLDKEGTAIPFAAMGRNAMSPYLKDGTEIVIYHGTGLGAIGGHDGAVYLYKDAMIIRVGVVADGLKKVRRIDIAGK